jgi:uncharacterized membrane-anchored protein
VTVSFWVVEILATTAGGTVGDVLGGSLGLAATTAVVSLLLLLALAGQWALSRSLPAVYWLTVVLSGVAGTLVVDDLTDGLGLPLWAGAAGLAAALAGTLGAWWAIERTLSLHTIDTARREGCYWLAIVLAFALGTAVGHLVDEQLGLGRWPTALLVALVLAAVAASRHVLAADAVLTFWVAAVLTRPLGASLGDGLARPPGDGGLGLGPGWTGLLALVATVAVVAPLVRGRRGRFAVPSAEAGVSSR